MLTNRRNDADVVLGARTDDDGVATLRYDSRALAPTAAAVSPDHSFWATFAAAVQDGVAVDVAPLPAGGPYGWWHQMLGMASVGNARGRGIRIGVVDTGCGPHPA